jgi:hypothetical protein
MAMKKFFSFIVLAIAASVAQATLIAIPNVSEADFNNAFNNERIWYAQFQPGGSGSIDPDNEFEHGGTSLFYFQGNTSVTEETDNPFEVNVSSTAFLSTSFNGIGSPVGDAYGITKDFNTIWIGLKLVKGDANGPFDNTLEVNTHVVDGTKVLPDMYLEEQTSNWTAFKFYDDDQLTGFGNGISLTGNINPDMWTNISVDEQWTYTVFATQDTSIIPEPSSFVLLLGALVAFFTVCRKRMK